MKYLHSLDFLEFLAQTHSIRKAASRLAITSSALNRKLLALEEEVGTPLFERLPSGVRLNTAGELFLQHVRTQNADLNRVLAQITDLSGLRRGHVSLAVSQDLQSGFINDQIAAYRQQFPGTSFTITDKIDETLLESFSIDFALCLETLSPTRTEMLDRFTQRIHAVMSPTHPLAQKKDLRLYECRNYPLIMPETGILRTTLELAFDRKRIEVQPIIYSDNRALLYEYLQHENAIGFQFPLSTPSATHQVHTITLHDKDTPAIRAHLFKSKGRILPVPSAKFLDFLINGLHQSPNTST